MSVEVKHGVNFVEEENFVGRRLSDVLAELRDQLNIPRNATILVNDREVSDPRDYLLQDRDTIEAVRPAGVKG